MIERDECATTASEIRFIRHLGYWRRNRPQSHAEMLIKYADAAVKREKWDSIDKNKVFDYLRKHMIEYGLKPKF